MGPVCRTPRLVVVTNLWTLAGHPSPRRKWTFERKVREVKVAGFDSVTASATDELASLLRDHGLRYTGFFSSSDEREFGPLLQRQLEAGAENVYVQLRDDTSLIAVPDPKRESRHHTSDVPAWMRLLRGYHVINRGNYRRPVFGTEGPSWWSPFRANSTSSTRPNRRAACRIRGPVTRRSGRRLTASGPENCFGP